MAEKDKIFYYLKLSKDFMDSDKIDFLMSQKNGAEYVVLYQQLILQTINTKGEFATKIGEVIIPYDVAKIQRECKWFSQDTIIVALEIYKKLGMVYKKENENLAITSFENFVGSRTYWAERKEIQNIKKRKNSVSKFKNITQLSSEQFLLPNGTNRFIDEKRYGGNGMKVWDRSNGKCEICGSEENLCLHHNNGNSNAYEDLVVVCRSCHRKIEENIINWNFSNKYPTNIQQNVQFPLISNILISNILSSYNFNDAINDIICQWYVYKKEKKSAYKEMGFKQFLSKLKKEITENNYGDDFVVDCFEYCMSQNWQGFFWKNGKNDNVTQNKHNYISSTSNYMQKQEIDKINEIFDKMNEDL